MGGAIKPLLDVDGKEKDHEMLVRKKQRIG
jgi:hypothetical protein